MASICPKDVDDSLPSYGYLPAIDGVVSNVREALSPRCLPVALPIDPALTGAVSCQVVTSYAKSANDCDCAGHGWRDVTSSATLASATRMVENAKGCSLAGAACDETCYCEVPQLEDADLLACQSNPSPPATSGFCYINGQDGETQVGNPALVRSCSASDRRLVRITGEPLAVDNPTVLVCDSALVPPGRL